MIAAEFEPLVEDRAELLARYRELRVARMAPRAAMSHLRGVYASQVAYLQAHGHRPPSPRWLRSYVAANAYLDLIGERLGTPFSRRSPRESYWLLGCTSAAYRRGAHDGVTAPASGVGQ